MEDRECCCECGCETGRAGRGEDSLYAGEFGPYCEDCWESVPDTLADKLDRALGEIRILKAEIRELGARTPAGYRAGAEAMRERAVRLARAQARAANMVWRTEGREESKHEAAAHGLDASLIASLHVIDPPEPD